MFFYDKSNLIKAPDHTRLDEFKAYRVCAQRDTAATALLQKHGIETDPSNGLPSLFRKVAAKRCDLGLASDVAIYTYIAQDPKAAEFGMVKFPVLNVPGDILINARHKDAQKLAREWTQEIEKMQFDGRLLKLAEKNFGSFCAAHRSLKIKKDLLAQSKPPLYTEAHTKSCTSSAHRHQGEFSVKEYITYRPQINISNKKIPLGISFFPN